jgi:gliding motility-associated-like protein
MSANPIYSKEGEYKGALAMISDITDKVKLQQQLITEQINKQKEIVKAVMLAQEKELNYLGQELHDNVNQILASTKLYLNDVFETTPQCKYIGLTGFDFQIYNRGGQLVFRTNDMHKGWDGKYKNQEVPQGVYIYVVTYSLLQNEPVQQRKWLL